MAAGGVSKRGVRGVEAGKQLPNHKARCISAAKHMYHGLASTGDRDREAKAKVTPDLGAVPLNCRPHPQAP